MTKQLVICDVCYNINENTIQGLGDDSQAVAQLGFKEEYQEARVLNVCRVHLANVKEILGEGEPE